MQVYPYFDAHCDTIALLPGKNARLFANDLHLDLSRLSAYAPRAQIFALFVNMGSAMLRQCKSEEEFVERVKAGEVQADAGTTAQYHALLQTFRREMAENAAHVLHCRSGADIRRATAAGKTAALLSIEGAEQLFGISLDEAYADGVRLITLTWNYNNAYGGSCITGGGLTEEGRRLVRRANELGIILDLSHGSDELFNDVAALSVKPFVASHSNARAVRGHRRNLTDAQFRGLVEKGGVAGINLYADFLSEGACNIGHVVAHIQHFLALGGEKSIALGGDLDGCDRLPEGIGGVQDVYKIADALASLGYSDDLIKDLFYYNLLRVISAVIGEGK